MPKIARFYILHCTIGFALSALFTIALLWLNVANLWHLISTSDIGVMAVTVFWILNGIVFAGVQCGVAIMLMTEKDDDDEPRGGRGVPVRVMAKSGGRAR
ncbi:hypothetical protein [Roseovarius sp. D0-M9]|uniref:hypothetical protein n=1 Tax=Roseovarius sp. D0-M9 TaxID=3127117 RepID=UPI00301032FD